MLFHHGIPAQTKLLAGERERLVRLQGLSPSGRQAITVVLRVIDTLDIGLLRLQEELVAFAKRQLGCQELQHEFGIGPSAR